MERDFMGAAGNEQLLLQHQHRQRAAEDEGARKESAYFGAGGPPPMDWSFASRAGAAPAVMSFRSAAREDQRLPKFSTIDLDSVSKQQASRVLTQQRSFGAENQGSPQYTATRGAYGVPPPQQQKQQQQQHAVNGAYGGQTPQQQQQQHHVVNGAYGGQPAQQQQRQHVVNAAYGGHSPQQQHAVNGARVTPVSSPLNPMFKVQSPPNQPNGAAAGGPFKQPPFAVNNAAVAGSRVGVYARNMPKPKMAQLTIFYAGSVNVFNNVSPEKAQELMVLASRGSLPSAPSTVARSPDANLFARRGSLPSAASTVARSPDTNLFANRGSLPSAPSTVTRSPDANLFASRASLPSAPSIVTRSPDANLFAPVKVTAPEVPPAKQLLPQMQQRVSPPVPGISKPISTVSQASCLPKSASSSNIDSTVPKSSGQLVMPLRSQPPSTHPGTLAATTATAIMPRAVPQARKASLARFLEKRKERVTTVAPYSSGKSPMESNDTVGSSIETNKSSLTGITVSSNREKSVWRPRNISFSGECPSTSLHI